MQLMSSAHLSINKLRECIVDWRAIGVKAVQLTGGGEPLSYPHISEAVWLLHEAKIKWSLVTNGIAMARYPRVMFRGFDWVRVGIDAGCRETYGATRRVPASQWDRAWAAVQNFANIRSGYGRVGVSFVVTNENAKEVFACAVLAKRAGADNIRIGVALGQDRLPIAGHTALEVAKTQVLAAIDALAGSDFEVFSQIDERLAVAAIRTQDYDRCFMKDLTCVVAGDANVYSCCTLAFHPQGLLGSIRNRSFRSLWESPEMESWRRQHLPRRDCQLSCLHHRSNVSAAEAAGGPIPEHVNYV